MLQTDPQPLHFRMHHAPAVAPAFESLVAMSPRRYTLLIAMLLLFVVAVGLLMGSAGSRRN